MPQDHQQEDVQPWNRFTYSLRVWKWHKIISKRICSHEAGSLAPWEQENVTTPSTRKPATMKQVHSLTVSRQMPQNHQKEDLQLWSRSTYFLGTEKCHNTISERTCSYETGSFTPWEQENATRPSERRPAAIKQVHLHTECRNMPQDHQQENMQPWNWFTYKLRAGKYDKTMSKGPATMKQVCLLPNSRKIWLGHQQEDLKQ